MPRSHFSQQKSKEQRTQLCLAVLRVLLLSLLLGPVCTAEMRCLNGASPQDLAKALLTDNTELAHPPVEVSLPPSEHSIVVLVRARNDVNTNFQGWVAMPGNTPLCQYRSYALPKMTESPGLFDIDVRAVFGATAGTAKQRYLVVLYRYHKNGSEQDSGYACYVYEWNGEGFESEPKLADRVVGLKTAAAVRSKLRGGRK